MAHRVRPLELMGADDAGAGKEFASFNGFEMSELASIVKQRGMFRFLSSCVRVSEWGGFSILFCLEQTWRS
ncbi:hypothetical protein IEQ34_009944 [Dendrobium chrysotoxum]|uniref:Uncharacterized protein n=1 Tax=Dendrobium chrysotoxum TaxID=161865 RepID=A0AAV7H2T9_DENCH|nr:hypothetical protein IEQ34_009944 [Dendrobium chrysotoxum]